MTDSVYDSIRRYPQLAAVLLASMIILAEFVITGHVFSAVCLLLIITGLVRHFRYIERQRQSYDKLTSICCALSNGQLGAAQGPEVSTTEAAEAAECLRETAANVQEMMLSSWRFTESVQAELMRLESAQSREALIALRLRIDEQRQFLQMFSYYDIMFLDDKIYSATDAVNEHEK